LRAHEGTHYTVHDARIFTRPDAPPPVVVSGFGPRSAALAGRIGDGYWNTAPDPELLGVFRDAGGAGKPAYGKLDTCVAADEATAGARTGSAAPRQAWISRAASRSSRGRGLLTFRVRRETFLRTNTASYSAARRRRASSAP